MVVEYDRSNGLHSVCPEPIGDGTRSSYGVDLEVIPRCQAKMHGLALSNGRGVEGSNGGAAPPLLDCNGCGDRSNDHSNDNEVFYNQPAKQGSTPGSSETKDKAYLGNATNCNGHGRSPVGACPAANPFHLFDNSCPSKCLSTNIKPPVVATKLAANAVTPAEASSNSQDGLLTSSSTGLARAPLRVALPPSYYKLHKVPSLEDMAERKVSLPSADMQMPNKEQPADPSAQSSQNGVHNKILDQVIRTPGRQPSPQPTHLAVPGSASHKVLQEHGSGYVAPRFEGKELQMEQGIPPLTIVCPSIACTDGLCLK